MSDDLIERLRKRKVFNGNTTVRRDGPGGPWTEERQTETDPLCDEAATALAEAQAEVAANAVSLEAAEVQVDRMREALQLCARHGSETVQRIARAALLPVARDRMEG